MYTLFQGGNHTKHNRSFTLSRPGGISNYVILHILTPAQFQIDNQTFYIFSNSVIIIKPNTPYQYSAVNVDFINDWMHFTCDNDSFEYTYAGLFNRPIQVRNSLQITQYFQHILWEYYYASTDFKQQNIDMLFQIILNKLLQEHQDFEKNKNYSPYASTLQELRLTMQSRPNQNFTPQELAAKLNVSASYFQHLYKDFFGISFKKDLIDMRLNYASDLLLNTTLTIEQVAYMSGYSNEIHFYRQFKKKNGMTPKEYQLSMSPIKC